MKETEILFLVRLSSLVNFFLAGYNLLLPYTESIYAGCLDGFYSKALAMEAVGGGIVLLSLVSIPVHLRMEMQQKS